MARTITDLHIDQPIISIFASGNSIHTLSPKDLAVIRSNSFLITMNYAPINIESHLNVWSDRIVSDWMENHYSKKDKDRLFLVREKAFSNEDSLMKANVDYWFNERREQLLGNYTVVWLLQLIERHFSNHRILVFGLDFYADDHQQAKWYDKFTDYDRNKRNRNSVDRKLNRCIAQLNQYIKRKPLFLNCNPESRYKGFKMVDWREVLQ